MGDLLTGPCDNTLKMLTIPESLVTDLLNRVGSNPTQITKIYGTHMIMVVGLTVDESMVSVQV